MRRIWIAGWLGALVVASGTHPSRVAGQVPQGPAPAAPPSGPDSAAGTGGSPAEGTSPHGTNDPHAGVRRLLSGPAPPVAHAEADGQLPTGTVHVDVVDPSGQPVAGAPVRVGVLAQGGDREQLNKPTNEAGAAVFTGLATGQAQSYRVTVVAGGARFGSTPFQLPPQGGYRVRVTRLPTTRDGRVVVQLLNRTFLELRDERVHVVQQAQLVNMTPQAYVFPAEGHAVRLPDGFTAFQSQPTMTDQRVQATDEGFLLRGSLLPGRTSLVWAFDLPLSGEELSVGFPLAWRTYEVRVESDAPKGLGLAVRDLPEAFPVEADSGRRLLVTGKRYRPEESQPSTVRVKLSGIPGPSPARWGALALALVFVGFGLSFLRHRADHTEELWAEQREALLSDALSLEQQFRAEEIGPKYHARESARIAEELALLLQEQRASARVAPTEDEA